MQQYFASAWKWRWERWNTGHEKWNLLHKKVASWTWHSTRWSTRTIRKTIESKTHWTVNTGTSWKRGTNAHKVTVIKVSGINWRRCKRCSWFEFRSCLPLRKKRRRKEDEDEDKFSCHLQVKWFHFVKWRLSRDSRLFFFSLLSLATLSLAGWLQVLAHFHIALVACAVASSCSDPTSKWKSVWVFPVWSRHFTWVSRMRRRRRNKKRQEAIEEGEEEEANYTRVAIE